MIAGSIAGTCVGGGATVGIAQLAGSIGLSAVWFTIGLGLSLLIMGHIWPRAFSPIWALASMVLSLGAAILAGLAHTAMSPIFVGLGVSFIAVFMGMSWKKMTSESVSVHVQ